jgi:hypothetical protein
MVTSTVDEAQSHYDQSRVYRTIVCLSWNGSGARQRRKPLASQLMMGLTGLTPR